MSYHTDSPERQAAIARALKWIDENKPPKGAAIIWRAYSEPDAFSGWDIRCMDDCEYVALVPRDGYFHFMEQGSAFGCCNVDTLPLGDEWELVTGYHS
jgi:hypothetical protein